MPKDLLYGRVAGFQVDFGELCRQVEEIAATVPAVTYKPDDERYVGWAITSRDASVSDGVRLIASPEEAVGGLTLRESTRPTELCRGEIGRLLGTLSTMGMRYYRVRLMRLRGGEYAMPFHRDCAREAWRLHVPIVTTSESYFEWMIGSGPIERVHLSADGTAWLVRVDALHRAVNGGDQRACRTHLLMDLAEPPPRGCFGRSAAYPEARQQVGRSA